MRNEFTFTARAPLASSLAALLILTSTAAFGHHRTGHNSGPGGGDPCTENCEPPPPPPTSSDSNWMHSDVGLAHGSQWDGTGTTITVIDDHLSGDTFAGRLDPGADGVWSVNDIEERTHGGWTLGQTLMVAPGATHVALDWNSETGLALARGFNAVNLSYGLWARNAFASAFNDRSLLGQPHESALAAVSGNLAFAAKAAGNDSTAVGASVKGQSDVFALQFINVIDTWDSAYGPTAPIIFVGAMNWNMDSGNTETLASYSNYAGSDPSVRNHFLVVGVEGGRTATNSLANYGSNCGSVDGTCLYGTSFAAPIVTGYAAIVAQKFTTGSAAPSPSLVANRLLTTAINDFAGYSVTLHGQGEASLKNALAPTSITGN